jgi:hypothetical protein
MFNACSWGPTHQSLTDIDGGYNLGGASFPRTTLWPSQPAVSTFHLSAPSSLQFNQALPKVPKFKFKDPIAVAWSFDHSAIYCDLHLCLAIHSTPIDLMQNYNITKSKDYKLKYKDHWLMHQGLPCSCSVLVSSAGAGSVGSSSPYSTGSNVKCTSMRS